ncbi:efflux RND transporter periplasmic adaptor subunit [Methylomonas koyamae]|uniref:efflux RND transporter periplasmic adaptor subunit n=1 Tax=Methylomonas koyamae TaxID=702114 RepID=UPI002873DAD7|nr:efflux RND transporter periplasmic adaptor subunit [Methylomonas koyamae]WNB76343.1 efflux RND transporter periplasmic adaptor subunit [Methylomonas koyamae]
MNDKSRWLQIVLPAAVLSAAVGAAWAMIALRPGSLPAPAEPPVPRVEVVAARPQTLKLNVRSQGVVAPREAIDLIAQVTGKVDRIHPALVSGGFFKADEVLATIDPRDYDYAIVATQAKIAEAKRVLINERAQAEQALSEWQALGQGEASDLALRKPQLAEAEAKLQAAEADLAKAKLDRSRCEIRAPFSGRVLSKQIGRGQFLPAGASIARIYANDIAEIRLPVGINELAFLDLPLSASGPAAHWPAVTLSAEMAGKPQIWQGRIVRSEAELDSSSGQLFLVAQVEQPDNSRDGGAPLLSGLFVQAEIEGVARAGLYALPRNALNNLQQVKLVDADRRLVFRDVEVLRSEPDRVVVKSGLQAGERIVVSDLPLPVAGMRVEIAPSQP